MARTVIGVNDPKAVKKGIGPQRGDFKDFWFNVK